MSNCQLQIALRTLFTQHAVYTLLFMHSVIDSLQSTQPLTTRLLQNQVDIGNAIKPIVGEQNGNKLAELLKQHILAAAGAINAIKSGDKNATATAIQKVFENSRQVSTFISSLNPDKLSFDTVLAQFNKHNQYVIDLTSLYNQKKYPQEITMFDAYYAHMMMFSDMLFNGLAPSHNTWFYLTTLIIILIIILLLIYYCYHKSMNLQQ